MSIELRISKGIVFLAENNSLFKYAKVNNFDEEL